MQIQSLKKILDEIYKSELQYMRKGSWGQL